MPYAGDPSGGVPDEEFLKPFRNEGKEPPMRPVISIWQKVIGALGGIVLVVLVLLLIALLIALTTQGKPFV